MFVPIFILSCLIVPSQGIYEFPYFSVPMPYAADYYMIDSLMNYKVLISSSLILLFVGVGRFNIVRFHFLLFFFIFCVFAVAFVLSTFFIVAVED